MKKSLLVITLNAVALLATTSLAVADDRADEVKRVRNSANVLNEIMQTPDKSIPDDVMKNALCVAVVPSSIKAGFIFGGEYGRGVASCHNANGWSAPAPFTVAGGTWGLQIGGEAVDLVLLVMNDKGMDALLSSKFKLGADAAVAAGPVGRQAEGGTDWKMKAEVLAYSRARGVFAGLTVNGAVIAQDHDATRAFYGKDDSFKSILNGDVSAPAGSAPFLKVLRKFSAQAQTAQATPQGQPVQR
jgi:lipid-binding SYLF domain-containing protein